jgi:hypothetical protein
MKKTVTRLASRMSSIWALPGRAFAGVKRLVLMTECGVPRQDGDVERSSRCGVGEIEHAPGCGNAAQVLGDAVEPVTWRWAGRRLGDEVEAMTDSGAGPPDNETTFAGSGPPRTVQMAL